MAHTGKAPNLNGKGLLRFFQNWQAVKKPVGFLRHCYNRNEFAVVTAGFELNRARCSCKNGVIFAETNIFARMYFGTALTNNDVAGLNKLTTKLLDTKSFAF